MKYLDWGTIPYIKAYEQQKAIFETALRNKIENKIIQNNIIFCEHPPVITIGKHGLYSNLLLPTETLKAKQIEFYHTDRGGDITYHGPGQIICYPILDLEFFHLGLKDYIYQIEEVIIRTIAQQEIKGKRLNRATGVWVETNQSRKMKKIAAIGIRSSRYITMHGFALNVNTDLSYFQLINPCGFIDKGVTSIQQELGYSANTEEIKNNLRHQFQQLFI